MSPVCIRIGCSELATTRLLLDPVQGVAALDNLVGEHGAAAILCNVHAARVQVPKGWTLDDRRRFPASPSPDEPTRRTEPQDETGEPAVDGQSPSTAPAGTTAPAAPRPARPARKSKARPQTDGLLAKAFAQAEIRSGDVSALFCAS